MTNLKKSLALVLALVMALGLFSAGAAFSDVPATNEYKEAIDTLSDLGILTGYTDGTFAPAGTITRAEACAVVYRSVTGKTNSNAAGATAFSDVAATHWASGFINYCTEMKIVNGYPDGTFKPNNPVTFAEMATMLVRALGLDDGTLSYPVGYLVMADTNYITDDADLSANDPAPRGVVANMAYHTIFDAKYEKRVTDTNAYPTIAESVLQIKSYTGVVTAIGTDSITVSGKSIPIKKDNSLLGLKVKVSYKGADVDNITKAYAAVPTGNTVLELKAADIAEVTAGTKYTNKLTKKDFELDSATYLLNFAASDVASTLTGKVAKNSLYSYKFISNDSDAKYEYVLASKYTVQKVLRVTDTKLYLDGLTLDLKDADGKATKVTATAGIKKDDYALVYRDADTSLTNATVTVIPKASGLVSALSGSKYTVGGTAYAQAEGVTDLTSASLGKTVDYYVAPIFGFIVEAAVPDSTENVLLVKDSKISTVTTAAGATVTYTADVVFPDGTASTITLKDATEQGKVDIAAELYSVWTYTVADGKYTLGAAALGTDIADSGATDKASKDGSFLSVVKDAGAAQKLAVNADSVIYVVDVDAKKVTAFVGTVPSFTVAGATAFYKVDFEVKSGFNTVSYAVINVGDGTMTSTESDDVLGYVESIRYEASGSKYVGVLKIAANGTVSEYTTVAVAVGDLVDSGYAKKFVTFDITTDGINDIKNATTLTSGYVMGINSGFYAITNAGDSGIEATLELASNVKVYTIDKDGKVAVDDADAILTSSDYTSGDDFGYNVVYGTNTDGEINRIFVYTDPDTALTDFTVDVK